MSIEMGEVSRRLRITPRSTRETLLPFAPPFLGEEEIQEVVAALRSGWISRGPRTAEFEAAMAERLGAATALGLNSCTAGLHLALKLLDVGPGDEVVVPTMTFCASANVVEHLGGRPVLVDVEHDTLNIDPQCVADAITEHTRALMVVHYGGHPAEMDLLEELAAKHGLAIVEDAAHALPAAYRGRMVGSTANLTSFSFYATKNLTTGEGGLLTGAPEFIDRARRLSLHGMSADAWQRHNGEKRRCYEVVEPGFKYNMTDVHAALGLRQLERLDAMQERRLQVVALYQAGLAGVPGIELPVVRDHVETAWHLFPIRVTPDFPLTRDEFIDGMTRRNIGTSIHFMPLHLHPYYRDRYDYRADDFPVAYEAYQRLVSLPLHPGLSDQDVYDVVAAVEDLHSSGW